MEAVLAAAQELRSPMIVQTSVKTVRSIGLEVLKAMGGVETHLVMSRYARLNIEIETSLTPKDVEALADTTPILAMMDERFPLRRLFPTGLPGLLVHVVEEILADVEFLRPMVEIASSDHSHYDGGGYGGVGHTHGEQPSKEACILAVADVFDAMASDRAYRKRMAYSRIYDFITGGAGHHFDPKVVSAFTRLYHAGRLQSQPV